MFPVPFEFKGGDTRKLYHDIFDALLSRGLVEIDDIVIFTKGDLDGVEGSTNAMKILQVRT